MQYFVYIRCIDSSDLLWRYIAITYAFIFRWKWLASYNLSLLLTPFWLQFSIFFSACTVMWKWVVNQKKKQKQNPDLQ